MLWDKTGMWGKRSGASGGLRGQGYEETPAGREELRQVGGCQGQRCERWP